MRPNSCSPTIVYMLISTNFIC
uniref:Uncharacterized protein n=1 Tax=Rhizophora mucronata TaxID=61149 RepID=A0A2P2N983_RHIMU